MCRSPTLAVLLIFLPAAFLAGCDRQSPEPFSVEVRVETQQGTPVEGAFVRVRPCYRTGGRVICNDAVFSTLRAGTDQKKTTQSAGFASRTIGTDDGAVRPTRAMAREPRGIPPNAKAPRASSLNIDPSITPIFPNPFPGSTTLRVQADTTSSLRSTIHTLDGAQVQVLFDGTIARGRQALQWSAQGRPDGTYELRTRLRAGGETVAQDTTYAVLIQGPGSAAPIGPTGDDGRVSTTNRVRFPSLSDLPPIDARDATGVRLGTLRVSSTVQLIVTTPRGRETYRRSVRDGKNTFTLSFSP